MTDDFSLILACYRSGQMSERQWHEHLRDPLFKFWFEKVAAPIRRRARHA